MFHTAFSQPPTELSRVYHCCWEYGWTVPSIRLSAM
jgi:hypothetical protein